MTSGLSGDLVAQMEVVEQLAVNTMVGSEARRKMLCPYQLMRMLMRNNVSGV